MGVKHALLDVTPLRRSAPFRRLWFGQALSRLGGQMTLVAVMYQVWQTTHSTVWTGAVGLAQAVPLIVLGLFIGSLVDRVDRRKFYLIMTAGQAGCVSLLALQGLVGQFPTAAVLLLVAVQSCFTAGSAPASRTFIPRLLPEEQRAAGVALNRISFQGAMLAGPALGGLILGLLGVGGCYLIDALTFAAAFYGAFGLPRMSPGDEPARPGLRGVADGLAFLVRAPVIRGALLTDLATTVLSMPVSLFPQVNAERFGDDPRTLGLFLTAVAVGGVAASLFAGSFTRLSRPGLVMLAGSATWGAALALFGLSADPWAGLAFLALAGAADTVSVVSRSTLVQLHTPDELLGRVSAAEQIVGQAGPDLGNLRGGLVADATSGTTALVSGGLLCIGAVALVGTTTPGLRWFSAPSPRGAAAG
ncbi:MFS transporter [Streptomyces platensis]|uniref:Enterobactin exporter EntS n=1 Tax=Streptomyces platensis TaxID=58346 RepID=A0AAE6NEK0_STRPT|nr:MFS transporter [Streptomyces platensis]OSY44373.1 Enterobactin exporter EntS [Streptomyces platensis]QEV50726.1 MFS transporter [Streptomyces platensis]